jgi:hypothetical protein
MELLPPHTSFRVGRSGVKYRLNSFDTPTWPILPQPAGHAGCSDSINPCQGSQNERLLWLYSGRYVASHTTNRPDPCYQLLDSYASISTLRCPQPYSCHKRDHHLHLLRQQQQFLFTRSRADTSHYPSISSSTQYRKKRGKLCHPLLF